MVNIINLYCDTFLKPIEEEVNYFNDKLCSHNFFDWLNRNIYRKNLEKYENLLYENYLYFGNLLNEEMRFQKVVNTEFKDII